MEIESNKTKNGFDNTALIDIDYQESPLVFLPAGDNHVIARSNRNGEIHEVEMLVISEDVFNCVKKESEQKEPQNS